MGKIKEAAESSELAPADPKNAIETVLSKNWGRITAVMPRHMSPDRLLSLCTSTINKNPLLAQCTVASLLSCFMRCSSLGLEPSDVDGLGRAYILPYKTKNKATGRYEHQATFILGYKGMLDLARRSGDIKDIVARAVYEGDHFEYGFGLNERLEHRPSGRRKASSDPKGGANLTHVYMIANFTNGGHYMDVMTADECEATRKRSKSPQAGPWVTDYEAMCKKTVIRRAFPYLPISVEAQEAAAADETDGGFVGQIELDPIIDIPVLPASDHPEEPVKPEQPKPSPDKAGKARASAAEEAVGDTARAGLATRKAVCTFCGHSMEKVAADATLDDLNQNGHAMPEGGLCEHPHYEWSK